ncbi:MAG: hypothetical protein IJN44_08345 [Clostridia bacterium]|nr:hypothetical protein [Clostridia bacterium]
MDGEDKAEIKAVKGFLMGKEEGTRAREAALGKAKKGYKKSCRMLSHTAAFL